MKPVTKSKSFHTNFGDCGYSPGAVDILFVGAKGVALAGESPELDVATI